MNIDSLVAQFQTYDELKIFCNTQFKQIQLLAKKNKELEEKLEKASKAAKEVVKVQANPVGPLAVGDDAKTIAQIQLRMLKDQSFERELDTDEAKRVELYNRILKEEDVKEKPLKATIEVIKEADLLKLVE